jgi:Arc/MetJ-type ribon-helix-helix transcriptional regulator
MPQRKLYPNPLQVVFSDEQMDFITKKADECYYGIKADVVREAINRLIKRENQLAGENAIAEFFTTEPSISE